jgi:hypothetical protein
VSRDQLARIPRLLDVKPGKEKYRPKIAAMLKALPQEVERLAEKMKKEGK